MNGISSVRLDTSQSGAIQLLVLKPQQAATGTTGIVSASAPVDALSAPATSGLGATQAHRHPHHPHGMSAAIDAASQLLGSSKSEILAALKAGQSLASTASAKGMSTDALQSAIAGALQQGDSTLSAGDAATVASRLMSATPKFGGQAWGGVQTSQSGGSTMSVGA